MSLCAIKDTKSKSLLTKNGNKMDLSLDMNNSLGWTPADPSQVDLQQRPETTNIQQVLESSLIVSVVSFIANT